jgi:DNA-binding transcriptional MocR family regulator
MNRPVFSERIARLRPSVVREILTVAQAPGVISFAGGLPAPEWLPALTGLAVPTSLGQYGPTPGEPELRRALSAYLARIGLECPSERILILSGSQQGIDLVAKLFVDLGSRVVSESPTYLAALQVFDLFGASVRGVPFDGDGLSLESFEREISAPDTRLCYLNPTFQNPTGRLYNSEQRARVASILDRAKVPLFEDDPYRELAFDAPAPAPIVSALRRAPWVYQSSFSKMFMPGMRLGFLACSAELWEPLERLKQAADLHANRVSQWLALSLLEAPDAGARLSALRASYRQKRAVFAHALERELSDLAEWQLPSGGLFFWLRLKEPRSLLPLLSRAIERGVAFVPGEAFFPGAPVPGYLRLNFSNASSSEVALGLARLSALLRE